MATQDPGKGKGILNAGRAILGRGGWNRLRERDADAVLGGVLASDYSVEE